jgi:hypothetical protein
VQSSGGGESFDGRPVQRQSILVRAKLDEETPGLVDDLAEVRRILTPQDASESPIDRDGMAVVKFQQFLTFG